MEILYLIGGLIGGAGVMYLVLRNTGSGKTQYLEEKLSALNREAASLREQMGTKEEEIRQLNRDQAAAESDLKHLNEKLVNQKEEMVRLQKQTLLEFENLANRILDEKSKKFTDLNKSNLDALLNPLKENIKEFKEKVEKSSHEEQLQRKELMVKVAELTRLNESLGEQAENLTHALKGDSKAQGDWGEMILESILEKSGLVKDREYKLQQSFKAPDGNRLQPDVVVSYPGNRSVIIDAKVSLTAYERYVSENDPGKAMKHLREHIASVRGHINELNAKDYLQISNVQTLDFIMMFIPVEPAYLLAIREEPDLWNYAYERRILLISPTNLLTALKMIASLWRQEYQNKNAIEIARQSGDLLDKFIGLLEDLKDVGNKLSSTRKSYDEAMKKLDRGRGNLIGRAKKIQELGAKTKKQLPDGFNAIQEGES